MFRNGSKFNTSFQGCQQNRCEMSKTLVLHYFYWFVILCSLLFSFPHLALSVMRFQIFINALITGGKVSEHFHEYHSFLCDLICEPLNGFA